MSPRAMNLIDDRFVKYKDIACYSDGWVKHSWPNQNSQPDLWMHDHPA